MAHLAINNMTTTTFIIILIIASFIQLYISYLWSNNNQECVMGILSFYIVVSFINSIKQLWN